MCKILENIFIWAFCLAKFFSVWRAWKLLDRGCLGGNQYPNWHYDWKSNEWFLYNRNNNPMWIKTAFSTECPTHDILIIKYIYFLKYYWGMETGLIAFCRNFNCNTISWKGHHGWPCRVRNVFGFVTLLTAENHHFN